jgi:ketosteroid isomerase-like protein
MSEENVEIVRRLIDAVNRIDNSGLMLVDPAVMFQDYPGLPDAEWHQGHEGMLASVAKLREVIGNFRLDGANFLTSGDQVLFDWRATGHGRRARVPVSLEGAAVATCRSGKLVRLEVFVTREEALEAAGLSE